MRVYEGGAVASLIGKWGAMQFGRVYGFVTQRPGGERWLTVVLDTGREIRTVRDEVIPAPLDTADPGWLADQLVQETIGNELAGEGWEAISEGAVEAGDATDVSAVASSPIWIVRRL
jgi:hypothetical protein